VRDSLKAGVVATAVLAAATASACAAEFRVALIYGKTGPLETYAKQTEIGLRLDLSSSLTAR